MKLSMFITTSVFAAAISTQLSAEAACDATMMQGRIAQVSATHATVHTSVLINATPAEVWATLADFDTMASWSTGTLQGMTGDIEDGGSVPITFIFGTTPDGAVGNSSSVTPPCAAAHSLSNAV